MAGQGLAARVTLRLKGMDIQRASWLFLMSSLLFVMLLPFSSYVAALSFIQEEWDLNNTQAGAIFSAYLAGYALSALLIIPMTDRFGSKYIFIGSAILSIISHTLFPLVAEGVVTGTVLRALAGVGLAGVYMPGLRLISERFANSGRGMAIGTYVTAFYGANSVSLAATGGLMAVFEWREAYLIMSLAAIVSLPIAYLLLRNHREAPGRRSSGRLDLKVLKNREARYHILGYSLHAAELYAVRVWLPAFLMAILVARGYRRCSGSRNRGYGRRNCPRCRFSRAFDGRNYIRPLGTRNFRHSHFCLERRVLLDYRLDRSFSLGTGGRRGRSLRLGDSG